MRRLGVDPGTRRIGLALSEADVAVALPHKTIEIAGAKEASRRVAEEVAATGAAEVVVGLPIRTDGSEGESARRARALAASVEEMTGTVVVLWDERLTTAAAERSLSEAGVRGRRRRAVMDQAAATLILQSYLDSLEGRR
jgi:putative Holliday junction resolvase